MAKKFSLLLLDANVVIEAFRLGIWDQLITCCDVHLSRTIVETEAHFYLDQQGNRHDFDLSGHVRSGAIQMFDVELTELAAFRAEFDPVYLEKLDPGETESLIHLLRSRGNCLLCSADKIVFRVLGNLRRGEQGISLEEVLTAVGLGRALARPFTRAYREEWTKKGFAEGLGGLGHRPTPSDTA